MILWYLLLASPKVKVMTQFVMDLRTGSLVTVCHSVGHKMPSWCPWVGGWSGDCHEINLFGNDLPDLFSHSKGRGDSGDP